MKIGHLLLQISNALLVERDVAAAVAVGRGAIAGGGSSVIGGGSPVPRRGSPVAATTNPNSFEGVAKKAEDGNPEKREGDQGGDDERDDGGDEIDCHCVVVHILGFMRCENQQTTS